MLINRGIVACLVALALVFSLDGQAGQKKKKDAAPHAVHWTYEGEEGPVPREGALRSPASSVYVRDPDGNLLEFMIYPPDGRSESSDVG